MAVAQAQSQLTAHDIIEAIGQLDRVDLENVAFHVSKLRTRKVTGQAAREVELIKIARNPRPREFNVRYRALIRKRQAETLTEAEYQELLRLTDIAEEYELRRIKALIELTKLRNTDLDTLMRDFDLINHG